MFPNPLPPRQNSPLQIVSQKPAQQRTTYFVPTGGVGAACSDPFEVAVSDLDLNDRIDSRWYIDRGQNPQPYPRDVVLPTQSARRLVTAPATVMSRLVADGKEHLVEVFVTDSLFQEAVGTAIREPQGKLVDGGDLLDIAYVDTFTWIVTVQPCQ